MLWDIFFSLSWVTHISIYPGSEPTTDQTPDTAKSLFYCDYWNMKEELLKGAEMTTRALYH